MSPKAILNWHWLTWSQLFTLNQKHLKDEQHEVKENTKLSKDISYCRYFSEKSELLKLIGISIFGVLTYFQYYTFVILSERLGDFSIQQKNYAVLIPQTLGRLTFFFVLPFATRRFLNFFISSAILLLSLCIFLVSYYFSGDSVDLVGIAFTGRILFGVNQES